MHNNRTESVITVRHKPSNRTRLSGVQYFVSNFITLLVSMLPFEIRSSDVSM